MLKFNISRHICSICLNYRPCIEVHDLAICRKCVQIMLNEFKKPRSMRRRDNESGM